MRAALLVVALAGCIRGGAFECQTSDQCVRDGTPGTCEPVGLCSFADPTCPSGQRYGGLSGSYANACVGQEPVDAAVDAPRCPASYTTLAGAAHVYRLIGAGASWQTQRDACVADGAFTHLVIPANAAEVTAFTTLSPATTWIGIDDILLEGHYLTVLGLDPPFLPWDSGEPDNTPGNQDCVELRTNNKIATTSCSNGRPAICECTP